MGFILDILDTKLSNMFKVKSDEQNSCSWTRSLKSRFFFRQLEPSRAFIAAMNHPDILVKPRISGRMRIVFTHHDGD